MVNTDLVQWITIAMNSVSIILLSITIGKK